MTILIHLPETCDPDQRWSSHLAFHRIPAFPFGLQGIRKKKKTERANNQAKTNSNSNNNNNNNNNNGNTSEISKAQQYNNDN